MRETGASTPRSRTGLRFRERLSKLVQRPSSASGKSHLNVPELSSRDSSSVLSIKNSISDGVNTASEDSVQNKATLSLTEASTAVSPPFDASMGDVSSTTTSMNGHVTQIWHRALEAVMRDEEVKEAAILFDSLLKEHMKQEQASSTQPKSSSEQDPKNMEDALSLVDRTLQDATKAQQALDTTLGVFAVVKGLSSFVGSMLSECPPAALAWAGVCACIPIIAAPIEQHQSMIKGLRHIYARAPIYFDLTGNLLQNGAHSSDLGNSIRTNIQPLYEGILKYIMLSICSVHRGKFSRFWEAISGQAQWETLLNNIEKAEESSLRNIQTIHGSKLLAVTAHFSERYTRAADREEDRRRHEYLHELKGMDYKTRLKTTERRLDGTCQWFRQHPGFRGWLDSDGGLLLVSASAGCGKSVLAKYLIEELLHEEDDSATICYFFFKDSDPQARSSLNASKAILHGFLKSNPEMVDTCMEELPIISDNVSNTDLWSAFDKLSRAQGAGRIICVLDALDECDPTERDGLINSLKGYVIKNHSTIGAKFIVTTRGYPQIVNLFADFSSNKIHLDGDSDEEKRQIQKEISIVMDHQLNKLETTVPDISPATLDVIRTGLIENSTEQRTYLWLHLMFDYIHKNRFCTREEWREIFRNPPDTVDRTYEGLLQSVTPQAKERVRTLLALILAAQRPLSIAELSTAVNCRINTLESRRFDLDDVPDEKEFGSWMRWECGSFVTIYEGKAFLIHQTAKEFLLETTKTARGGWQGSMTKHVIHQFMAESCISFLSLEKFQRQEYAVSVQTKIPWADEDRTERFLIQDALRDRHLEACRYLEARHLEPFVVYSAMNWMHHFRQCQQSGLSDRQVTDVGKEFFDLYLSLFTKKRAESYITCGEWRQRAWYLMLMASKPPGISSQMEITQKEYHLLSPETLAVSSLACIFDHRRLLVFALDVLGEETIHTANDLATEFINTRPGLSLPHFAACGNSSWCLSHLQTRGHNLDLQDFVGQTPLHKAMMMGNEQVLEVLLKFGASKISLDCSNMTPLTWALISMPGWIKEYIASSDSAESELRSLLYFSATSELPGYGDKMRQNWITKLQKLRELRSSHRRAARLRRDVTKYSPLRIRNEEPNMFAGHFGNLYDNSCNALHLSVQDEKRIHNTLELLKHQEMVHAADDFGNTPLHTATLADNVSAIRVLLDAELDRSVDYNCKGERGDTPLHTACKKGHRLAAEVLLQAGADPYIRNDDGLTAVEVDRPPHLGVGLVELIRKRDEDDL
ncbi:Vegetative incompatibility protein HET-E-1 [Colletotrichum siamense]|uniref:Vegetative incompatibility protein HET-E-1 n=1 Tax=Colletotrichum siamense TaxID=690259 RepID=UPI001872AAED|nr:Vegetative incompatibility protein HET-E-1 [Colletotrichum siamense]KAF5487486.1 Vegetative incompatibility protein HET-E-1 [Colletotrichum siamense]